MTDSPFLKHAWFSEKAKYSLYKNLQSDDNKKSPISHIYLDKDGNEVEVTTVGEQKDFKYLWDDKVYIGIVTTWIRNIY